MCQEATDYSDVNQEYAKRRRLAARRAGVIDYKRRVIKMLKESLEAERGTENSWRPWKAVERHPTVDMQFWTSWECERCVRELTDFRCFKGC